MSPEQLTVYSDALFILLEKLRRTTDIAPVVGVRVENHIFKAYYLESRIVFEIMNDATSKTIFHTTQAPNFYIDTTLCTDTSVVLMFMSHLSDRNLFNRVV